MVGSSRSVVYWSLAAIVAAAGVVGAQTPKKLSATAVRALDTQADKARTEYLKSLGDLAKSYDDAGLTEKSKEIMEAILAVNPEDANAKKRLKEIGDAVYDKNEWKVNYDPAQPWMNAGVMLTKDQPVRFEAEGDYKVFVNETLGPDGYANDDPTKDLIAGIPMGALMGAMSPPGQGNRRAEDVRPFNIGGKLEFTPKADGPVFLKVNAPPGAKVTGKIRLTIRGNFKPIGGAPRS
jgi:hypothetical protein